MTRVVVVGAGVGGLTTAAVLAKAGVDVTVLEAHIYPGGCAGTFFYQGYRFDVGATLAGGFAPGGPMDLVARAAGVNAWPAHPAEPAMRVHLPEGEPVDRWADGRRWEARRRAFGAGSEPFWRWQERTADAMWDLALRLPPWPPQSRNEFTRLGRSAFRWLNADGRVRQLPELLRDGLRPAAARLGADEGRLRSFIDAQLLIAAQTTSERANALYSASALDLPRRGVVHFRDGMGAIAEALVSAVRRNGGRVEYRRRATRVVQEGGRPIAVETRRGDPVEADIVIINLPPANVATLLGNDASARLRAAPASPRDGWGAFVVYAGLDASVVPADLPLHNQVVSAGAPGETNTVFLSLSPAWDGERGPDGRRALTLSTHTRIGDWWKAFEEDRPAYERRKDAYVERMLRTAERALPGLRDAAALLLPGTPVTFQRFTLRQQGWVGGFPQTNLLRTWGPRIGKGLWMVGDSIFPGQSTAAVALGGLRVAQSILQEAGVYAPLVDPQSLQSGAMLEPVSGASDG